MIIDILFYHIYKILTNNINWVKNLSGQKRIKFSSLVINDQEKSCIVP